MITSKQRAKLRAIATKEATIFQLGKDGITENFVKSVSDALDAREIVKFRVLENSLLDVKTAAQTVADELLADVVTVIGSKAVIYRKTEDNILDI